MVAGFEKALTPETARRGEARGLSVRQLVTLASIVEKETGKPEERPLVAAVYRNRLRIGMALQCDPTVIYALQRAGRYNGNLTRDDLQFDSPYNTYRYPGLPPGPDRRSRPGVARGRRPSRRRALSLFRQPRTTARTPSPRRSTNTIATCDQISTGRSEYSGITSRIGEHVEPRNLRRSSTRSLHFSFCLSTSK